MTEPNTNSHGPPPRRAKLPPTLHNNEIFCLNMLSEQSGTKINLIYLLVTTTAGLGLQNNLVSYEMKSTQNLNLDLVCSHHNHYIHVTMLFALSVTLITDHDTGQGGGS